MMKTKLGLWITAGLLAVSAMGCDKKASTSKNDAGTISSNQEPMGTKRDGKFGAMTPKPMLMGLNLEGADFGSLPGKDGQEYKFPQNNEVDYWASKNVNFVRIGIAWEREQVALNTPFVTAYNNQLLSLVAYATSKNINVLINPQTFMRWNNKLVGSSAVPISSFVDFWTRMSTQFKDNNRVWFGLNNEPNSMSSATLINAENQAIAAIRATGAKNVITTPGNGYTGVASFNQSWVDSDNKLTNANMLLQLKDSGNNSVVELHFYWDQDAGGSYPNKECTRDPIAELSPVVAWAKTNNKKILIGEFGVPNTATCQKDVQNFLQYVYDNNQYIVGASFWSGGNFWGGAYLLDIYPKNFGKSNQIEDGRVAWMTPFWSAATNPITAGSFVPNWSPSTNPTTTATTPVVIDSGAPDSGTAAADAGSKDAGATIVDAGKVDAGATATGLLVSFTNRNKWSGGSCWDGSITNNGKASTAFHAMTVDLGNGGKLRDMWNVRSAQKWGASTPIKFSPSTPQWIASGKSLSFGFCEDHSDPQIVPVATSVN